MVDFAVPTDHRIKPEEREKKDKYLDLCKGIEKNMEHDNDNYISRDWFFWYSHQRMIKVTG